MKPIDKLLVAIRQCRVCEPFLEMGVNPVVRASETAELLIVGQAPGRVVHQTSIPWNDKSGDNLRNWLDMDKDVFYDTSKIAIVPMGFCYPGTGKSGDLAPRPECAPLWHSSLLTRMPKLKLILLIGQYAQKCSGYGSSSEGNISLHLLAYLGSPPQQSFDSPQI